MGCGVPWQACNNYEDDFAPMNTSTRVLVVEDESGIALGLGDTLQLEGYQVEVVTDGASPSRRALEESPWRFNDAAR